MEEEKNEGRRVLEGGKKRRKEGKKEFQGRFQIVYQNFSQVTQNGGTLI